MYRASKPSKGTHTYMRVRTNRLWSLSCSPCPSFSLPRSKEAKSNTLFAQGLHAVSMSIRLPINRANNCRDHEASWLALYTAYSITLQRFS